MVGISADMIDRLQYASDALGAWRAPLFCCFLIVSGSLPLPGFGALVVASGFLFGFPYGFLLVYPSAVVGSMIAFALGRRIPESWRDRFFPKKLLALQHAVAQGGFSTLLLLRLTPLPFAFSNLLLGSSPGVPFWSHAAATAIGFLRLALNSYLGTTLNRVLTADDSTDGAGAKLQSLVTFLGTMCAIAAMSKVGHQMVKEAAAAAPVEGKAQKSD